MGIEYFSILISWWDLVYALLNSRIVYRMDVEGHTEFSIG